MPVFILRLLDGTCHYSVWCDVCLPASHARLAGSLPGLKAGQMWILQPRLRRALSLQSLAAAHIHDQRCGRRCGAMWAHAPVPAFRHVCRLPVNLDSCCGSMLSFKLLHNLVLSWRQAHWTRHPPSHNGPRAAPRHAVS